MGGLSRDFKVCAMCGQTFHKMPCSIYTLHFAGKVHHFCTYSCYTKGKEVYDSVNKAMYTELCKEANKS